eukprot:12208037-Alexandrium_andersonii.AAC.1
MHPPCTTMLAAEGIMPTQPGGAPSPIWVFSDASSAARASPAAGPPEVSPTQPFSPERGFLTPRRVHARAEGHAASLPPLNALRSSFETALHLDASSSGDGHVRGGGKAGQGGAKASRRRKEDRDLAVALTGFLQQWQQDRQQGRQQDRAKSQRRGRSPPHGRSPLRQ